MLSEVEKKLSYTTQTYLKLKNAIITNLLKPGQILNERELSSMMKVSRTPLREALQLLQKDGWISNSNNHKIVAPITWKDIQEIYELRVVNELFALDLASKTFNSSNSEQMERILNEMKSLIKTDFHNRVEYLEKDKSFHLYIAKLGGNQRLYDLIQNFYEQFIRISFITFKKNDLRLKESYHEHLKIYEACKGGDFEKAKVAAKTHIEAWFNSLKENWEGSEGGKS